MNRQVKHKDRRGHASKAAAVAAARAQQRETRGIYRIWPCPRCPGQWHVAAWAELVNGTHR